MTRGAVACQIERLYDKGGVAGLSEGQLLDRFVVRNDPAAFEALVSRHGPMVLAVCRRWLRDPNDVDDAFQATFLVLVRKAATLRRRELLGNWLYGVASRVAAKARATTARRAATESSADGVAAPSRRSEATADPELHEEVLRLPEKYRSPVVLCYLEGLTHEEAAARLSWPVGTVKGRLARARDLLRSRLIRRGISVASAAAVAEALTPKAEAAGPLAAPLVERISQGAALVAANRPEAGAGVLSARAISLSEGVLHTMSLAKLKTLAVTLAAAGTLFSGAGVLAYQGVGSPHEPQPTIGTMKPTADPGRPTNGTTVNPTASEVHSAPTRPQPATPPNPAPAPSAGGFGPMAEGASGGFGGGGGGFDGGVGGPIVPLGSLRIKMSQLAPRVAARDKSPRTKQILSKLDEALTMSFPNETSLEDVLKYIKTATQGPNGPGIPIYLDPAGLSSVEKTMTSTVVVDLEGVPLKTSLRLILKQLDLAYCVRDGLLIISSVEGVYQELLEAENENPQ